MKKKEINLKIYNLIIYILIILLGMLIAYILILSSINNSNDTTLLSIILKVLNILA